MSEPCSSNFPMEVERKPDGLNGINTQPQPTPEEDQSKNFLKVPRNVPNTSRGLTPKEIAQEIFARAEKKRQYFPDGVDVLVAMKSPSQLRIPNFNQELPSPPPTKVMKVRDKNKVTLDASELLSILQDGAETHYIEKPKPKVSRFTRGPRDLNIDPELEKSLAMKQLMEFSKKRGRPKKEAETNNNNNNQDKSGSSNKTEKPKMKDMKKTNRELQKLLQDEGAVNMLYSVEKGEPESKDRLLSSKTRLKKVLKRKAQEVAEALLESTGNTGGVLLRQRIDKTRKPSVDSQDSEQSTANEFSFPAPAEASRIIRRHSSSSSYSSRGSSPRRLSVDLEKSPIPFIKQETAVEVKEDSPIKSIKMSERAEKLIEMKCKELNLQPEHSDIIKQLVQDKKNGLKERLQTQFSNKFKAAVNSPTPIISVTTSSPPNSEKVKVSPSTSPSKPAWKVVEEDWESVDDSSDIDGDLLPKGKSPLKPGVHHIIKQGLAEVVKQSIEQKTSQSLKPETTKEEVKASFTPQLNKMNTRHSPPLTPKKVSSIQFKKITSLQINQNNKKGTTDCKLSTDKSLQSTPVKPKTNESKQTKSTSETIAKQIKAPGDFISKQVKPVTDSTKILKTSSDPASKQAKAQSELISKQTKTLLSETVSKQSKTLLSETVSKQSKLSSETPTKQSKAVTDTQQIKADVSSNSEKTKKTSLVNSVPAVEPQVPKLAESSSIVQDIQGSFPGSEVRLEKLDNLVRVNILPTSTHLPQSFNTKVLGELCQALDFLSSEQNTFTRAIVLNSASNDGIFCSGIDLPSLLSSDLDERKNLASQTAMALRDFICKLSMIGRPVLTSVSGKAIGLGVVLLAYCDYVLSDETATFYTPYSKLGYIPEAAATLALPHVIGHRRTSSLLLGCTQLDSREAEQCGLVSKVVPSGELESKLMDVANSIATQSLQSMVSTKALLMHSIRTRLPGVLNMEVRLLEQHWSSDDCQARIRDLKENPIF